MADRRQKMSHCLNTGQIVIHKAMSWHNHLARQQQNFCLNTNTRTGCWRNNARTTKTETSLFLNLGFFPFFFFLFLCKCLFSSVLLSIPPHPVDFFGSLLFSFFFFLLFLSWYHYFYHCKSANTKLNTGQGWKQHHVEWWEDKKGMETILQPNIN
jgi:hypothetical protein